MANQYWMYSTTGSAFNKTLDANNTRPDRSGYDSAYILPLTVTKGHTYNFSLTKPATMSFKITLTDVSSGSVQDYQ